MARCMVVFAFLVITALAGLQTGFAQTTPDSRRQLNQDIQNQQRQIQERSREIEQRVQDQQREEERYRREQDERRRRELFEAMLACGAQVWATGTDRSLFRALEGRAQFFSAVRGQLAAA